MTSNTSSNSNVPPSDVDPTGRVSGEAVPPSGSRSSGTASPADYIKWTDNLDALLNDPTGLDLFQHYLKSEDRDRYHMLKFWLACRGLHKQPKDRISDCIKVIYTQLFLKIGRDISSNVGKAVAQQILNAGKDKIPLNASVFEEASRVVYDVMSSVMYPNFLRSETYFSYAQRTQPDAGTSDNNNREATALPQDDELPKICNQPLAVVEEDQELSFDACSIGKQGPESLRQDSELQSLSSGARTDSQTDLTHFAEDMNSVSDTGKTYVEERLRRKPKPSRMKNMQNAPPIHVNDYVYLPTALPAKQWNMQPGIQYKPQPLKPKEFIHILMPKLQQVKQEIESGELVRKKIESIDDDRDEGGYMFRNSRSDSALNRLEDDDQDILDKHVERIWSDKTPKRSPSVGGTPIGRKSPEARRSSSLHSCSSEKLYYPSSSNNSRMSLASVSCSNNARRKDRDAHSLLSLDSGNNTDLTEYVDHNCRTLAKHRMQFDYAYQPDFAHSSHHPAYTSRTWTGSQKTITDSGVSVLTKSMADGASPSHSSRDRMVSSWQQEKKLPSSSKLSRSTLNCGSVMPFDKDMWPMSSKRKTKSVMDGNKIKEAVKNTARPGQPWCDDPNMPPLPFYKINATDTLEETRRRLKEMPDTQPDCTSVFYKFSDEPLPYLVQVPGRRITLRMFKEKMPPKKGNFRYFFEKLYEEYDNQTVLEEINEDDSVLPLLKGKVRCQIKIIK